MENTPNPENRHAGLQNLNGGWLFPYPISSVRVGDILINTGNYLGNYAVVKVTKIMGPLDEESGRTIFQGKIMILDEKNRLEMTENSLYGVVYKHKLGTPFQFTHKLL